MNKQLAFKIIRFAGVVLLSLFCLGIASAQDSHYTSGPLDVDIYVFNPCGSGPANGSIRFTINNAQNGASGSVNIQIFGPPSQTTPVTVPVGSSYTFNPSKTLPAGSYNYLVIDNDNTTNIINSFATVTPAVLTQLPDITLTDEPGTNLTNTSCSTPNGKVGFSITGGSRILSAGGSFKYTITSTNGVVGFPLTGTTDGTTTLDLVTLLNASNPPISGLPGGTYALTLNDNYSSCGANKSWTITDPSPTVYNTSAATPTVCLGSTGTVQLSNSENSAVTYEIYKGGVATGITLTGTNAPLNFTIPSSLLSPVGSYTFTIRASNGFCTPAFMNLSAVIVVNPLPVPTISGITSVCAGTTGVAYSTETGKSGYSWSVTGGTITSGAGTSSIVVTWTTSGGESVNVNYIDANGCTAATSTSLAVVVNPNPVPTITGASSVCIGSTGITYTTETGKTGYLWTVAGGTITAGSATNSITVTWTTAGPQSVSVNYTDANGCTAASSTVEPVTVNNRPVPTIAGPASACLNSNSVYTSEVGDSGYSWTVSAGGTITAGIGTSSVTINWTTTGVKTVSVTYTDANGCSPVAPTSTSVTVNPLPAPTITGSSAVCAGTSGVVYSTEVAQSGYLWTVSAGGTITAGANTNAITVTWTSPGAQTVSVNYSDVNGCTAPTATVENVSVNPLPVPTITGSALVCAGATGVSYSTETGMTGYSWTVSGGVIATGTGTNTITVNWSSAGAQTITVTYTDVNGCSPTLPTSFAVTVNTLPVPTITGNLTACLNSTGNTYTTETGNSGYAWNVVGGTITAGTGTSSVTVTWTTSGSQSINVNYTNVNGCSAASATSQAVTVNPLPVPTITGSPSVCVGSVGLIYTTESGKTGYMWAVTGGTIVSGTGTNSITVDWTLAGSQSVTINYTDVNGCSASSATSETVAVNALPVPVITGATSVCTGSTGNTYSTAPGQIGYVWSVSAGGTIVSGASTNIISVTWSVAGAQSVFVNYTDVNGCTAASASSKSVTVNPLPVPTITGAASACVGSTGNNYVTEAGNSAYNWTVTGGSITAGATTNSILVTWSAAGTQSVNVSYTDLNGCTAATPASQSVTVINQPVPTITGTTSVCNGATGVGYLTEAGKTGYNWTVSGGSIISGIGTNSISVDWTTAGAGSVSVNYTDVSGCQAALPTSVTVTVNSLPVPTITGPSSACLNSTGNVYTTQPGKAGYGWTVSSGGTITAGAGTNAITVSWLVAGAQQVTITYSDVNGCSPASPSVAAVTVNNLPAPTISGSAAVCANASALVYSTEAGNTGYIWSITGGSITAGATTNSVTVTWFSAGSGNLMVTYTDANGCTPVSPASFPVTINSSADATINPAGPFCSNSSAVTLTSVNPGGTWSGTGITNSASGTFDPAVSGAGTFIITYSLTVGSCSDTKTTSIIVNPKPDATITPAGPYCVTDLPKTLTAATIGGTWSGTGITNAAAGTFDPATAGVGTFTITYSVTTAAGCSDSKTTNITVGAKPDATITPVGPFCSNDPIITLTAATAGGSWSGSPGITSSSAGTFNPSFATTGNNTITYTVTVGGCTDTKSTTILINAAPDATITPAGPFCTSDPSVLLTAATAGGTWSGAGITNTSTGRFDPGTAGVGTWTIAYSVSNASCSDAKSISIVVGNPPDATINPPGPLCSNGAAVILTSATPGGTWSGTGITNVNTGKFDPTISGAGSFLVTNHIVVGGCTDTKSATIVVSPAPDATITPAGPFCSSDAAVNLTAATTGGTWSGTGITDVTAGTFDPTSVTPGTYAVSYSVTAGGCTDTKSANIVVSPPPNATITPVNPVCNTDAPFSLTAATSGGTWSGSGVSSAGVFDPTHSGTGNIIVTYTVSVGGCTDTKTTSITVKQCGLTNCGVFTSTVVDTLPSCIVQNDGTIDINVTGGVAPYVVTLASSEGFSQGLTGSGPDFNYVNLSPADYTYTILDAAGNTCTLPYTLKLQTGLVVQLSNLTNALCFDGSGSATLTVISGGTAPYQYSVDGGTTWVNFDSPVTITNLKPSTTAYSVLARRNATDLCITEAPVLITGPGAALDTIFVKKTVSYPDLSTGSLTVAISESGFEPYQTKLVLETPLFAGQSYAMDWTNVSRNPNDLQFEYTFTSLFAGLYTLSIRDSAGCEKDYPVTISVDTKIFIPNIFTPNGDNFNDLFYIRNLPAETSVIISNRWGGEVYSSKDYKNDWAATGISDGIYYYRIKAAGQVFNGWLEIQRGL